LILVSLLLVAAWLAFFGDKTPDGSLVAEPMGGRVQGEGAERRPQDFSPRAAVSAAEVALATTPVKLTALVDRSQAWPAYPSAQVVDIFSSISWAPPAPVQPLTQQVVQTPVAPPLPYEVLGKSQESGKWTVFLSRAGQTVIAREGDVLEGTYEVRKIAPPQLTLDYIPLHQAQVLDIGDFE
jgi:hypothetical protein